MGYFDFFGEGKGRVGSDWSMELGGYLGHGIWHSQGGKSGSRNEDGKLHCIGRKK